MKKQKNKTSAKSSKTLIKAHFDLNQTNKTIPLRTIYMLQMNLEEAIKELKRTRAKKVFVQVPEGLKMSVEKIAEELEKNGFEVIISMDPCFGACDIKTEEAKRAGCKAILHLGHTKFLETKGLAVIYAPLKYELENFKNTKEEITRYLLDKNVKMVSLATTTQFVHYLKELKEALKEKGIKAEIGKGKRVENGQVLGCNYTSVDTKAKIVVYLGDGYFHPLGIHFGTKKEVIIANPFTGELRELSAEKDAFLKRRILLIEQAKEADSYAILVSTKIGQNKISEAEKIKKTLERKGKKAIICTMGFISEEKLLGLSVEAYINTACPRIGIDDYASYKKPMINYNEVPYLLGKKYEKYETGLIY